MPYSINLSICPIRGYIQVSWENLDEIDRYDYIAIYDGRSELQLGKKDPKTYLEWFWVNGRSRQSIVSNVKYHSDREYRAVYVVYKNNEYSIQKISAPTKKTNYQISLCTETASKIVLEWHHSDLAGHYDYVALFDYKPKIGAKNLNDYLAWEWAISNTNGRYQTSIQDNQGKVYFIAYCAYKNSEYVIESTAGIVEEYKLTNIVYQNLPSQIPQNTEMTGITRFELVNPGNHEATMSIKIACSTTETYSWNRSKTARLGVKNTVEGAIPFFVANKLEVSADFSYSQSQSETHTKQITSEITTTCKISANCRKSGFGFFKTARIDNLPYTATQLN